MSELNDIDGIAAEHALGSLTAAERAAVDARRAKEPALDAAIRAWDRRLSSLLLAVPPAKVPPNGLAGVLNRIVSERSPSGAEIVALRRGRNLWRATATGFGALAASLAIVVGYMLLRLPATGDVPQVAVLTKGAASATADEPTSPTAPVFLISYEASRGELAIRQVSGRRPPNGKAYELWLMPGEGRWLPMSLGLLAKGGQVTRIAVPPRIEPDLVANDLVISLEPETGSAPGSAMGPTISGGRLTTLLR